MRFLTVVGARPQLIKAAALSRVLRNNNTEILVHTGQHYDKNMSDVFFNQLNIPIPDFNLNVGSKSHGAQTAAMLGGIEELVIKEKPHAVIVYGDTNSTLAGALAASKLLVPIVHIEAGLRSYNMKMPEEQNRVLTDHISKLLLCPTDHAVSNLQREGIIDGVYNTGDIMYDTILYYKQLAKQNTSIEDIFDKYNIDVDSYYLSTIHRAENTDKKGKIMEILSAFEKLDRKVILPLHPRTKAIVDKLNMKLSNIYFIEPVGYFEMIILLENCKKVITDSGGLQKEAFFMEKQCITLREQTEWIETLQGNWNALCSINRKEIIEKVGRDIECLDRQMVFGNGDTSTIIVDLMCKNL